MLQLLYQGFTITFVHSFTISYFQRRKLSTKCHPRKESETQLRLKLMRAEWNRALLQTKCLKEKTKYYRLQNKLLEKELERKNSKKQKSSKKSLAVHEDKPTAITTETVAIPEYHNVWVPQEQADCFSIAGHEVTNEISGAEPASVDELNTKYLDIEGCGTDEITLVQSPTHPMVYHFRKSVSTPIPEY